MLHTGVQSVIETKNTLWFKVDAGDLSNIQLYSIYDRLLSGA